MYKNNIYCIYVLPHLLYYNDKVRLLTGKCVNLTTEISRCPTAICALH